MNNSDISFIWIRLVTVILLISIPIIFYINNFCLNDPSTDGFYYLASFLILYQVLPVMVVSYFILFFPLFGGILALLSMFFILLTLDPELNPEFVTFTWYIFVILFFSSITGLFIGIWNLKNRKKQVKKY
jgi:hypothetical protein